MNLALAAVFRRWVYQGHWVAQWPVGRFCDL